MLTAGSAQPPAPLSLFFFPFDFQSFPDGILLCLSFVFPHFPAKGREAVGERCVSGFAVRRSTLHAINYF